MGKLEIPLVNHSDRKLLRGWFQLADKAGKMHMDLGRVELCLRWVFDPDFHHELPKHMDAPEEASALKKKANAVQVFLIRAKNLPIMDKNLLSKGGSSDPVVSFYLEGEQRRSKVKKTTLCPVWKEEFEFAAHDLEEVLVVTVDDWDRASGNDFIGRVKITVDDLESRETIRAWYPLHDEAGKTQVQGRLELACRFVYKEEYAVELPKEFVAKEKQEYAYERPNLLKVFLIRARGLPALDHHPLHLSTSDPTCSLKIQFEEDQESTTKWKTLTPKWCETFKFEIEDLDFPLVVTAVDKDQGPFDNDDDPMGSVTVDLRSLRDRKVQRTWLKLVGDEATPRATHLGVQNGLTRSKGSLWRSLSLSREVSPHSTLWGVRELRGYLQSLSRGGVPALLSRGERVSRLQSLLKRVDECLS